MLRHPQQQTCFTLTATPGTHLSLYCTNASVALSLKAPHDFKWLPYKSTTYELQTNNTNRKMSPYPLLCYRIRFSLLQNTHFNSIKIQGYKVLQCFRQYIQYVLYCNLHLYGRNWRSWPSSGGLQSDSQPPSLPWLRTKEGRQLSTTSLTQPSPDCCCCCCSLLTDATMTTMKINTKLEAQ